MRIVPSLLLAAGFAAAVQVPVLSEPRSLPLQKGGAGSTADAWGDTLFAKSSGKVFRYVRNGNTEILLDSLVSDSIDRQSNILPGSPVLSNYVVVTPSRIYTVSWTVNAPGTLKALSNPLVRQGNFFQAGWATNPGDSQSLSPEPGLILCGSSTAYRMRKGFGGVWAPDDSVVMPNGDLSSCAIDPSTGRGVIASAPNDGIDWIHVGTGVAWNLLEAPRLDSAIFSSLDFLPAWSQQWMAYGGPSHMLRRTSDGAVIMDSIVNPGYSAPSWVTPARHDSLVVFAVDSIHSSLVLAKWTPDTFFFFANRISLGASVQSFMAIGDSVLWVQTDSNLISFRFSWQEASPSGIESRSPLAHDLAVTEGPMGTGFLWNGLAPTSATIQAINGRVVDRIRLNPGRTTWWRGSRSGLFLVRTPDGTSKFLVR